MSTRTPRTPQYRHYKPKDLGVVRIDGRDIYLGKYGSPESHEKYRRVIAEWLASGLAQPTPAPSASDPGPEPITVSEVILSFWKHAEKHYRDPAGAPTQELENFRDALRPLRKLYGRTPARDFGPLALRAVRESMIKSRLARTTVNARINRIRRIFKWAVGHQLIPAEILQALQAVEGLERGRSAARESDPVGPVPLSLVEATLAFLPRPVAAMVRLQLLTGCRLGEVVLMRGCDLTPGEPNWEYRPARHKNSWRGRERVIPLGPKAQAIVREFLKPDASAYLFNPAEVVAKLHARRAADRRSRRTSSEVRRRTKGKPGRDRAPRYDRRSYRQAITRACDRAFPHPEEARRKGELGRKGLTREQRRSAREELTRWRAEHRDELSAWRREHRWSPLQLRHTAATEIRARYGLEAAQVALGHAKADVTQLYAERDLAKAHTIMSEIG